MDPDLLAGLRALVDQRRLRIVARLAEGPADVDSLAADLRQPLPSVRRPVDVLVRAGLVEARAEGAGSGTVFAARMDRVGALGRELAALERSAQGLAAVPGGAWPHDGESLAET